MFQKIRNEEVPIYVSSKGKEGRLQQNRKWERWGLTIWEFRAKVLYWNLIFVHYLLLLVVADQKSRESVTLLVIQVTTVLYMECSSVLFSREDGVYYLCNYLRICSYLSLLKLCLTACISNFVYIVSKSNCVYNFV